MQLLKNQNQDLLNQNNAIKMNENNMKKIIEETENKVNQTIQYNDKITTQIREMEEEIENKDNIISQFKKKKEEFENNVSEKLNLFDDYVSNCKSYINNILKKLYEIFRNFDYKANQDLNSLFSKNFSSGITQILSQINSINNIKNYDIQLNDELFFEVVENAIQIIYEELEVIYDKFFESNKIIKDNFTRINTLNEEEVKNKNDMNDKIFNLTKERDNLFNDFSKLKGKNLKLEKDYKKIKNENNDLKEKFNETFLKFSKNEKTLNSNVKARKNFMNLIQKFIRQFPNKDFARIMLDILSLNEQIASDELNKNIIEDKLAFMLNDYDNSIKKKTLNSSSDLSKIVKKEHENLKKLITDYDNKIFMKSEQLNLLNKDYDKYEKLNKENINNEKELNLQLNKENLELRNRIKELENANEILQKNKQNVKIETIFNKSEPIQSKGNLQMKDLYVSNNNIPDIDSLESNFIERVNFNNNSNQNLDNQVVLTNYEDFENNSQDDE